MPTVGSSILRRQRSSSAANKKLGVTRISDTAASSRGTRADNADGDPTTPSPTAMSRAPAPSRSPPTPEPIQQRVGYNAGAQPMNRAKHLSPPKRSNLQDWDEWGAFENEVASAVTSVASTVTNMVNGNQRGAGNRGGGSSRYSPGQGRTPTRDNQAHHSVHDFMAATGAADVVNVVGRAAAFLGTAIDNAIENTAAVVENVSKRADQMAFVNSPKHGNGNSPNRRRRSSPGKHNDVNGNYRAPLSNLSPNSGLNKGSLNNDASSPSRRWNKNPRSPGGRRTPNKRGSKSPGGGSNGGNKIRVFRSPGSSGKKSRSRTSGEGSRPAAIPMKTGDTAGELADDWGWDAKSPTQAEKTRNVAAATAHLRRELTTVNAERDELVDAMSTLTKTLKALTDDHESLKKQNLGLQKRMASSHHESQLPGGSDPLAEQVRHQLEHLVKEKGKLAQENASLRRECESLQELLMYSNMASQVESMYSPGGIFGDVYGVEVTEAEADEETDGEFVAEEKEAVETSEAADDEPSEAEAFETGMLEAAEVEVVEETPAADVEAVNADADAEVEVVEPPEAPEDVVEVVAPAEAEAEAEPEPEPEPEPVVAADDIEPEAPAVPEVTEASEAPTGKKGKGKGKGKGKKGRR